MTKKEWVAWIETVKDQEGRQSGRHSVFRLAPDGSQKEITVTYKPPQPEGTDRQVEVKLSLSGSGINLLEHQLLPGNLLDCRIEIDGAHDIGLDLRGPEPVISASGLQTEGLALLNSQRQDPGNKTILFARVKR